MRAKIKKIGGGIEEKPTTQYIGYKYKGRLFGWITVYRSNIEIGTYGVEETGYISQKKLRVNSVVDNYEEVINVMKGFYRHLGGG